MCLKGVNWIRSRENCVLIYIIYGGWRSYESNGQIFRTRGGIAIYLDIAKLVVRPLKSQKKK